jgi:hypothetical protein
MHLCLSVHHIVDSDGSSAFSPFGRRLDAVQGNREAMANSPHNRTASIIPNIRRTLRFASFLRPSFGRKELEKSVYMSQIDYTENQCTLTKNVEASLSCLGVG